MRAYILQSNSKGIRDIKKQNKKKKITPDPEGLAGLRSYPLLVRGVDGATVKTKSRGERASYFQYKIF